MDEPAPPLRLRGFLFHPDTGRLTAPDGTGSALRPKTAALLHHLLRQRGRLVTRNDLLDAVWPGIAVTEDGITQCVGEIRRALGPEGAVLRTLPRRGYVLDPDADDAEHPGAPAAPPATTVEPTPAPEVPLLPAPSGRGFSPSWTWAAGLALAAVAGGIALLAGLGQDQAPAAGAAVSIPAAPSPVGQPPGSPEARVEAARLTDEARRLITAPGNARTNWLNARTLAERAIALDPANPAPHAEIVPTYTNMVLNGYALNPEADLREAEGHAERAVQLGPQLAASHAALGAVLRLQRRWEEARAAYLRAVELGPSLHAARANAGYMLVMLGRPDEAIPGIRATLAATRPDHAFRQTWLTYLALAELQREEWADAAALLRESLAARAFLPHPIRQVLLAAALQRSGGDPEQIEALIAEARRAAPNLTVGWFRAQPLSQTPAFLARQEPVLAALAAAGLPE
ncbi:winged helix-turn-helix domain-containing protein [Muricoccus radiodurans]|uniref:winged helix-turn-helix domain-containing protein n=1 Tax=Muricoccus radiodurans TaxID=2231721 RepID=UPI003CFA4986